eukprot:167770_1
MNPTDDPESDDEKNVQLNNELLLSLFDKLNKSTELIKSQCQQFAIESTSQSLQHKFNNLRQGACNQQKLINIIRSNVIIDNNDNTTQFTHQQQFQQSTLRLLNVINKTDNDLDNNTCQMLNVLKYSISINKLKTLENYFTDESYEYIDIVSDLNEPKNQSLIYEFCIDTLKDEQIFHKMRNITIYQTKNNINSNTSQNENELKTLDNKLDDNQNINSNNNLNETQHKLISTNVENKLDDNISANKDNNYNKFAISANKDNNYNKLQNENNLIAENEPNKLIEIQQQMETNLIYKNVLNELTQNTQIITTNIDITANKNEIQPQENMILSLSQKEHKELPLVLNDEQAETDEFILNSNITQTSIFEENNREIDDEKFEMNTTTDIKDTIQMGDNIIKDNSYEEISIYEHGDTDANHSNVKGNTGDETDEKDINNKIQMISDNDMNNNQQLNVNTNINQIENTYTITSNNETETLPVSQTINIPNNENDNIDNDISEYVQQETDECIAIQSEIIENNEELNINENMNFKIKMRGDICSHTQLNDIMRTSVSENVYENSDHLELHRSDRTKMNDESNNIMDKNVFSTDVTDVTDVADDGECNNINVKTKIQMREDIISGRMRGNNIYEDPDDGDNYDTKNNELMNKNEMNGNIKMKLQMASNNVSN